MCHSNDMKQYKTYYSAKIRGEEVHRDVVITATDPIAALDHFHRMMQSMDSKLVTTGVVVRPKLAPDEYKLLGMYQFYPDSPVHLGGTGKMLESKIDLPNSSNPDLSGKRDESKAYQTLELNLDDVRRTTHTD